MKKIFAYVLTFVMMLSLTGIINVGTASAANDGTITVQNAIKGQTYKLYKLFDAKYSTSGGEVAITYTVPSGKSLDGNTWFAVDPNTGNVKIKENKVADKDTWIGSKEFTTWAREFVDGDTPAATKKADNTTVTFTNLPFGYYYIDSTLGTLITIDSTAPNADVYDKNDPPTIDKEITKLGTQTANMGSIFQETGGNEDTQYAGKNEQAIAQVGDTISYKLTITVKPGAENYVINDTMTNLALKANTVMVDGASYSSSSKVDNITAGGTNITEGDNKFTIKLSQTWLDGIKNDTELVITYDAVLTKDAVVATAANPNTATLTWGHATVGEGETDPNKDTDEAQVWSAKINVKKTKSDGSTPLEGAGFVLKNANNKYYKSNDNGTVTWVDSEDDATQLFSNSEGSFADGASFTGLASGTYTLIEKTVPNGYNKAQDTTVQISDSDVTGEALSLAKTVTVINSAGSELPSTGGIGTTIFYVTGGILMAAAVILLITKKRMSAYKD